MQIICEPHKNKGDFKKVKYMLNMFMKTKQMIK